jgi:hypothetical protein
MDYVLISLATAGGLAIWWLFLAITGLKSEKPCKQSAPLAMKRIEASN